MPTKRQILIATVAACAAALAAPLAFAGGSTGDEPESNATIVYVDPGPLPDSPDPSGDVEQAEPPVQVTDTAEPAIEEVTEEKVLRGPRCTIVAKDYIVRDPDPQTVTTDVNAGEDASTDPADDATDAMDDGFVPGDLSGEESSDVDEDVIVEEPGAELAGP